MKLRYRIFRIRDALPCSRLMKKVFERQLAKELGDSPLTRTRFLLHFSFLNLIRMSTDPERSIKVATDEKGNIIGLATYKMDVGGMKIENLHIDPDLRGRGLGRKFLQSIADRIKSTGYTGEIYGLAGEGSRGFYERLGLTPGLTVNGFTHFSARV